MPGDQNPVRQPRCLSHAFGAGATRIFNRERLPGHTGRPGYDSHRQSNVGSNETSTPRNRNHRKVRAHVSSGAGGSPDKPHPRMPGKATEPRRADFLAEEHLSKQLASGQIVASNFELTAGVMAFNFVTAAPGRKTRPGSKLLHPTRRLIKENTMAKNRLAVVLVFGLAALSLTACGGEKPVDVEAIMAQPQAFVGSDTCKMCHLEHYDSWKMTLHSRTLQNAQNNTDAVVVDLDPDKIRQNLEESGAKPQVPIDQIFIPQLSELDTRSAPNGNRATSSKKTAASSSPRFNTTSRPITGRRTTHQTGISGTGRSTAPAVTPPA